MIIARQRLISDSKVNSIMVAPTVEKIRTANLPSLQLTPKETTYLLAVVAILNLVLGLVLGVIA